MLKCYLCGSLGHFKRPGKVRDNENLDIFECLNCGLVFLCGSADNKFYQAAKMHGKKPPAIEEWLKESHDDDERRFAFLNKQIINRDLLDFGCGAGGFLLKAKKFARNVIGIDLEERLKKHFDANDIPLLSDLEELPPAKKFDIITAFHVIEHLKDPADVLARLAISCKTNGQIIIEVPSANDALLTIYENKPFSEFTYWGCHLYLFNAENLHKLARMANLKVDFVKHIQRYSLANHLHWLANGKPGGHKKWSFLDSPELNRAYEASLASIGKTDTLIAALSLPKNDY